MMYLLIALTVVIYLCRQNGVQVDLAALLGVRSPALNAVAGRWSLLMTLLVALLVLAVFMSGPEGRLLFMAIDAIGFDMIVVFATLQIRSLAAGSWLVMRERFARFQASLWTIPAGPRPAVVLSVSVLSTAYIALWIAAQLTRR